MNKNKQQNERVDVWIDLWLGIENTKIIVWFESVKQAWLLLPTASSLPNI